MPVRYKQFYINLILACFESYNYAFITNSFCCNFFYNFVALSFFSFLLSPLICNPYFEIFSESKWFIYHVIIHYYRIISHTDTTVFSRSHRRHYMSRKIMPLFLRTIHILLRNMNDVFKKYISRKLVTKQTNQDGSLSKS